MANSEKKQRALNIALLITEFIAALVNLFKGSRRTTSATTEDGQRDQQ